MLEKIREHKWQLRFSLEDKEYKSLISVDVGPLTKLELELELELEKEAIGLKCNMYMLFNCEPLEDMGGKFNARRTCCHFRWF